MEKITRNDIAPINPHAIMEEVIAKGDLAKLTQPQRNAYYLQVCKSIGLNPLTKPFDYITLNGKLVLYAAKGCTDQLRTIHGVSVEDMSESERDGVFIVTVKVRNAQGRTDMAKGAVPIANLKGDVLANAIMKCETKAKRRATLSICGLGMLDESEIETIPASATEPRTAQGNQPTVHQNSNGEQVVYDQRGRPSKAPPNKPLPAPPQQTVYDPETGEVGPHPIPVPLTEDGRTNWTAWGRRLIDALQRSQELAEGEEWIAQNEDALANCLPNARRAVDANIRIMRERFDPPADFMAADDPLRPL